MSVVWSRVEERAETVAVVATGPSLRGVELVFHPGITVVAVNGAWGHVPADFWFTLDCSMANRAIMRQAVRHPETVFYAAVEPWYGTQAAPARHLRDTPELGVRYLRRAHGTLRRAGKGGLSTDPGTINTGNSGYGGLGLAFLMGAKRIALLGVDGNAEGGYAWGSGRPSGLYHLRTLFGTAVKQLKDAGVEVVVGSPRSIVDWWPRVQPQEALDWLVQLLNVLPVPKSELRKPVMVPAGLSQALPRRGALTPSARPRVFRTGSARARPVTNRLPNAADANSKGKGGLGSGHSPGQPARDRSAGEPNAK